MRHVQDHFKSKHLRSLKDRHDVVNYALNTLPRLGAGSSRVVFTLSSRFVLKVAKNDRGIAQNAAEVEIYTNPNSKPIAAAIQEYGDKYHWLISEIVRPMTGAAEFKKLTGLEFYQVFDDSVVNVAKGDSEKEIETILDNLHDPESHTENIRLSSKSRAWLKAVLMTVANTELLPGDLIAFDHWGKTSDGRVVVLDYGFTESVAPLYAPPPDSNPGVFSGADVSGLATFK